MTNDRIKCYNEYEILDNEASKTIKSILDNGNDAVIRRKGKGIVIMEDSRKVKYDNTSGMGRK